VPTGIESLSCVRLKVDGFTPRVLPDPFENDTPLELSADPIGARLAYRSPGAPWTVVYLVRPNVLLGGPAPALHVDVPLWRRLWMSDEGLPDWTRVPTFHQARRDLLDRNGIHSDGRDHSRDVYQAVQDAEGDAALAEFLIETMDVPADGAVGTAWDQVFSGLPPEHAAKVRDAIAARVRDGATGAAAIRARRFAGTEDAAR
jgi:hypothetical protein